MSNWFCAIKHNFDCIHPHYHNHLHSSLHSDCVSFISGIFIVFKQNLQKLQLFLNCSTFSIHQLIFALKLSLYCFLFKNLLKPKGKGNSKLWCFSKETNYKFNHSITCMIERYPKETVLDSKIQRTFNPLFFRLSC